MNEWTPLDVLSHCLRVGFSDIHQHSSLNSDSGPDPASHFLIPINHFAFSAHIWSIIKVKQVSSQNLSSSVPHLISSSQGALASHPEKTKKNTMNRTPYPIIYLPTCIHKEVIMVNFTFLSSALFITGLGTPSANTTASTAKKYYVVGTKLINMHSFCFIQKHDL